MMIQGYEVIDWAGAAYAARIVPDWRDWTPRDPVPFVRPAGSAEIYVLLISPFGNRYAVPLPAAAGNRLIDPELANQAAALETQRAPDLTAERLADEIARVEAPIREADQADQAARAAAPGLGQEIADQAGRVGGAVAGALGSLAGVVGGVAGQAGKAAMLQLGPLGGAVVVIVLGSLAWRALR